MRGPTKTLIAVAAVCAAALIERPVLGQDAPEPAAEPAAEEPRTVRALRYDMTIYHSAMDLAHRAGIETKELYFPDAGIVCNVVEGFGSGAESNAFHGQRRDLPPHLFRDRPPPEPPPAEEIEVPLELFERIRELADLNRRRAELAQHLREDLATSGVLPPRD